MFNKLHDDDAENRGNPASALLAGLGVDPSRLLPFLAAEGSAQFGAGLPPPTNPPTEGLRSRLAARETVPFSTIRDHPQSQASGVENWDGPRSPLPPGAGLPTPPTNATSFSSLDRADLARSVAPFNPDVPAVSSLDRAASASLSPVRADASGLSDSADFSIPARFDAPPAEAARPGRRNPDFESLSSYSYSTEAGSGGLEARLARAVDRLEQIAEQLGQSSSSSRGGPSRAFRGRVDG